MAHAPPTMNTHLKHTRPPAHIRFAVLATDIAIFTVRAETLLVRFTNVNRPPHFVNISGLPGGLLEPHETAEEACRRHIITKAGIDPKKVYVEQLATFSRVDRDPRGRVVSVAYNAFVPWERLSLHEQADTKTAWWGNARTEDFLAYDHNEILDAALARIKARIAYTTLIAKLMPKEFTLTQLEATYETILARDIDKRNFRKKIRTLKILKPLSRRQTGTRHRPAELFRFTSPKVTEIEIL